MTVAIIIFGLCGVSGGACGGVSGGGVSGGGVSGGGVSGGGGGNAEGVGVREGNA